MRTALISRGMVPLQDGTYYEIEVSVIDDDGNVHWYCRNKTVNSDGERRYASHWQSHASPVGRGTHGDDRLEVIQLSESEWKQATTEKKLPRNVQLRIERVLDAPATLTTSEPAATPPPF